MLGFSQGCIMITTLTAMLLKQTGTVPWKVNVLFCGIPTRDNVFLVKYMQEPLLHPCVVINGKDDPLYEWGKTLQNQYCSPLVLDSPEGHRIPRDEATLQRVADEILTKCSAGKL